MESDQPGVSTEALVKLLTERRRRAVLDHLRKNGDDPLSVGELAESLAARRLQDAGDELTTRLAHVDLPMLADAGVVEYDRGSSTVRHSSQEQVEKLIRFVEGERQ